MITRWNKGSQRHLAAKHRGRKIGLYGGSFNPSHKGHIYIAREAIKRLGLDEVWFLVSPGNPLKPVAGMAPFKARFKRLKKKLRRHPNLIATGIEKDLGTLYTADTVTALADELPHTHFVWIMGADNLATFDLWQDWEKIVRTLPIAVFDRSGYALRGFASRLARRFAHLRTTPEKFDATQKPRWTFLTIPRHPASATEIRDQRGEDWFKNRKRKDT